MCCWPVMWIHKLFKKSVCGLNLKSREAKNDWHAKMESLLTTDRITFHWYFCSIDHFKHEAR